MYIRTYVWTSTALSLMNSKKLLISQIIIMSIYINYETYFFANKIFGWSEIKEHLFLNSRGRK